MQHLSEPAGPGELIRQAEAEVGPVDVLVNNVGDSYLAKFDQLSEQQWEDMWQLNVMGFVRAIQAVLPGMRERKEGVIVKRVVGGRGAGGGRGGGLQRDQSGRPFAGTARGPPRNPRWG